MNPENYPLEIDDVAKGTSLRTHMSGIRKADVLSVDYDSETLTLKEFHTDGGSIVYETDISEIDHTFHA